MKTILKTMLAVIAVIALRAASNLAALKVAEQALARNSLLARWGTDTEENCFAKERCTSLLRRCRCANRCTSSACGAPKKILVVRCTFLCVVRAYYVQEPGSRLAPHERRIGGAIQRMLSRDVEHPPEFLLEQRDPPGRREVP